MTIKQHHVNLCRITTFTPLQSPSTTTTTTNTTTTTTTVNTSPTAFTSNVIQLKWDSALK
ncbi:hypothetical protein E2C01_028656 [Portunus trituberculatus]|uniref:Uncharacterized protein n=1 Tax=Portunus trituberculatus TaxID=210409 RepID=A0A5B7EPL4_PORTR|nr:hypothetical protein [Portunus trituberculatus]